MKGQLTIVRRTRARKSPRKEKIESKPVVNPNWCSCGSKQLITTKIQVAGKDPIFACAQCGERAPFHAHVSRFDKREFKRPDNTFNKVPTPNKQEVRT